MNPSISISIAEELKNLFPSLQLGIFTARVQISESGSSILGKMKEITDQIISTYSIESISSIAAIAETKNAYRWMGKDPSRYRPSAEALCRRIVNGKPLFRVNNIVDVLNSISIASGYSIGGYDSDKIDGDIMLAKGKSGEPYNAIGRGDLNIENLPVLYDRQGPFGCPTSDSTRTMVTPGTKNFLMVIFDFSGTAKMEQVLDKTSEYYSRLAQAENINSGVIRSFE